MKTLSIKLQSTRARLGLCHWLTGALFGLTLSTAFAQETVRIIVPFPAGGAADNMARAMVEKIKEELGANVVIENKPGASTRLAADALKQAAPDGRTVLLTVLDTMVIAPLVYKNLRYDPNKDFMAITTVSDVTYGIAVKGDGPYKTVNHFIEMAKADKKHAAVGISGLGSTLHFLAFNFAQSTKSDMNIVPYQGGPAMVTNLLGEQLPAAMDGLGVFMQQHRAGKVRVIAVSGDKRAAQLPDVPTFKELGMPQLAFGTAYGLYAPAGTPVAKINDWNRAMRKVLASSEVKEKLITIGYQPLAGSTPEELRAMERALSAHWAPIIKATNFTAE
jgi:tripartite-type tricarboxylate transporter receptor subunit TctC